MRATRAAAEVLKEYISIYLEYAEAVRRDYSRKGASIARNTDEYGAHLSGIGSMQLTCGGIERLLGVMTTSWIHLGSESEHEQNQNDEMTVAALVLRNGGASTRQSRQHEHESFSFTTSETYRKFVLCKRQTFIYFERSRPQLCRVVCLCWNNSLHVVSADDEWRAYNAEVVHRSNGEVTHI